MASRALQPDEAKILGKANEITARVLDQELPHAGSARPGTEPGG